MERKMRWPFALWALASTAVVIGAAAASAETFTYDLNKEGHIELEKDAAGRTLSISFFGADGKLVDIAEGYAREVHTYDDAEGKDTIRYYAAAGGPATRAGVHCYEEVRDGQGRLLSSARFSIDEQPCVDSYSVHKWLWAYDDDKYVKKESTYGVDGRPTAVAGIASTVTQAPDWGLPTSKTFFGIKGEPAADKYGVHRYEYIYGDNPESCSARCYDVNGELLPAEAVPAEAAAGGIPY